MMKSCQLIALLSISFCNTSGAVTGAGELSAEEIGYGVIAYLCDENLERISPSNSKNHQGSAYRACFEPNEKSKEDGVGIRSIESFTWKRGGDGENSAEQIAVVDGQDDGGLSSLVCGVGKDQQTCYVESMLRASFYKTKGLIEGTGFATMSLGGGTVEMKLSEGNEEKSPATKATMGGFSASTSATSTTSTNIGSKKKVISVTTTTSGLGSGN